MAGEAYRELGEAAWAWVLGQIRGDEGPWLPETVPDDEPPARPGPDRDSLYAGIGGLAPVLAELRWSRGQPSKDGLSWLKVARVFLIGLDDAGVSAEE